MADPLSLSSGKPGVLVWQDPAPLAQPELIEQSHVSLKPLPGKEATGKVLILDSQFVFAILVSLPSGDPTLTITTTIGNEVVNCETSATDGICSGLLRGDALIGGVAFIASSGRRWQRGPFRLTMGTVTSSTRCRN
ncbi:MAG: hypothetical protein E6H66_20725 [Betaproteobacteria bacterium]|nr:MAG: hypothetical protein E6H66_20725 [Betaproteobacteria bacterium]